MVWPYVYGPGSNRPLGDLSRYGKIRFLSGFSTFAWVQEPSFRHGFGSQGSFPISQNWPEKPSSQKHSNSPGAKSRQNPPFWHGSDAQPIVAWIYLTNFTKIRIIDFFKFKRFEISSNVVKLSIPDTLICVSPLGAKLAYIGIIKFWEEIPRVWAIVKCRG